MTVSSTSSRVIYLGNGSTTTFAFPFKVNQPADLAVVYTDATGLDYTLLPSQYAASGLGLDAGGLVTYPLPGGSPIAAGTRLTIYRDVAVTQPTSLSNQGAMWPQVIETALDRLTYVAQKVTDAVSRSLVISPTDSASLAVLPNATQRANSVLAFDSQGQPYAGTLTGSLVSVSTWIASYFLPAATKQDACNALDAAYLPGSNDFTGGRVQVPTRVAGDNGTDAASTAFVATAITAGQTSSLGGTVLRSYLAGLGLSNNVTTPNTKLDVAAGVCADSTNVQMLSVTASTLDCGTVGANGLDAGSLANNTWYHVFAIGKADSTTALLASTSLGSPTLPPTYTLKRRIGSFKTDGGAHIMAFIQSGDEFRWAASVADVNASNPGTSAVTPALSVPTNLKVTAFGNVLLQVTSTSTTILLSDPVANNEAPIATTAALGAPGFSLAAFTGGVNVGAPFAVRTDTAAQIRYRLSVSAADIKVGIFTHGWIDRRGRDD
jgi:hypothetical protein